MTSNAPAAAFSLQPLMSRVAEYAARQAMRRSAEYRARKNAVRFAQEQCASCRRVARCLKISPRTLANWRHRHRQGRLAVLEALARQHGPPLVLKSDNGSAFISRRMSKWLAAWKITSLLSPVRMPRYNGTCEAGIGGMKRRTEQIAARHNAHLDWTCDDLHAAAHWANHDHYPRGLAAGTAANRFDARTPLARAERDAFLATVIQYKTEIQRELITHNQPRTNILTAIIHRRAVRRALVEHNKLSIIRRAIPLPIKLAKRATIT